MSTTKVEREDAQAFVQSLKAFNDTLPPEQQAMLGTVLDAAQQDETAGYGYRPPRRNEGDQTAEDETAGYKFRIGRSESGQTAGEDETAGYAFKGPRRSETSRTAREDETAGYGMKRPRSEAGQTVGEDETAGYGIRHPRSDTPTQDASGRWEGLVAWLAAEGDETEGFVVRRGGV